ncbi:Fe-S-containing hydro-lyase [Halarsenatibacter silvermanii]|uniref:Fumarate hydratase subunit beta n=1 Tax=Halarsenatibacter silvermanii TaxID=321763 RepID=A0A1G9RII7_9FIRM|nr:Fe-S-containing hydro-lyase [Halarsenatibacter silvermanii]SDM23034.1 fumarate hydratase subunit beta [Halarsenatibacter silvermanii]
MSIKLETPLEEEKLAELRAGDSVEVSGIIYTARDAAHERLVNRLEEGENLPFEIRGQMIYYVGPAPAKPGYAIGPAGPTTSSRMDPYTPPLLEAGLKGMIGKGSRSPEVRKELQKHGAVYFGAVGGAAALISSRIESSEIIAYEELGPEAVRRLEIRELPLVVINDTVGGDLFQEGREKYRQSS